MSNVKTSKKMKSFVKEFKALVDGDSSEALAQKVLRQSDSALNTHIAIFNGELVGKEDAVSDAEDNLAKAKVNYGKKIDNRDAYVRQLLDARNDLVDAEEALELHQAKLAFLQSTMESLNEEV